MSFICFVFNVQNEKGICLFKTVTNYTQLNGLVFFSETYKMMFLSSEEMLEISNEIIREDMLKNTTKKNHPNG